MALIPALVVFAPGTKIKSAEANSNFDAIKTAFNASAVLTDVARTITVAHTFAADILFTDASFDIGKAGATRPRDGFFSRNMTVGGTLAVTGAATFSSDATVVGNLFIGAAARFISSSGTSIVIGTGGGTRITIDATGQATFTGLIVGAGGFSGNITGNVTGNVTGNLTGTVLTASQENITSLGILTALSVAGTTTFGAGSSPTNVVQTLFGSSSVVGSIGTAFSSGGVSVAYNAFQTVGVDSWTQSNTGITSALFQVSGAAAAFYTKAAGAAPAAFAAFWGNEKFGLNASSMWLPSGNRFYLDGASDTYLVESAANQVDLVCGGLVKWRASVGTLQLNAIDLAIDPTKRFYFDGGGDTYAVESGANIIDFVAGGGIQFRITVGQVAIGTPSHFSVESTKRIYFDGGSDTYMVEDIANRILFVTGGSSTTGFTASGVTSTAFFGALTGNVTGNLTGTILTASQTNITAVGTLTSLTLSGGISGVTTLAMTGALSGATSGGFSGTVTAGAFSGPLTGAVTGNVTGNLTGTVLTAAQANITSVGTLTSLAVSGALTAGSFTVPTAAQPNITSLGTLTGLALGGSVTIAVDAAYDVGDNAHRINNLFTVALKGLPPFTLGAPGIQYTLAATKGGAGAPVANAAQTKWLRITGSDGVDYYVPAFT